MSDTMDLRPRSQLRLSASLLIGLVLCLCPIAQAQPAKGVQELDRPLEIPDAELLNQRGEKIHFYSDLVKGHVVVIQSMFTTCTTLCPLLGAAFSHVQDTLGDASGVRLISISVDPATDTPERLKAWGARYHAGPNWTIVTGNKYEVDRVLRALKFYTADKLSHTALVLVGNDATGRWARTSGFVPAARIAEMVKGLMQGTVCFSLPSPSRQPAPSEASACTLPRRACFSLPSPNQQPAPPEAACAF